VQERRSMREKYIRFSCYFFSLSCPRACISLKYYFSVSRRSGRDIGRQEGSQTGRQTGRHAGNRLCILRAKCKARGHSDTMLDVF
jgi:hypothetical protein